MDGIQLAGRLGVAVSVERLDAVSEAAVNNRNVSRNFGEWLLDCLGLTNHKGAFKAAQDLAKARADLIKLNHGKVNDENEHLFLAAFERAASAAEDLRRFVNPACQCFFSVFRNSSANGKMGGGDIVIAGLGDQNIFECHFHPNAKIDKFVLITNYSV